MAVVCKTKDTDARMDKVMSYEIDESKRWCCPNCGEPWEMFKGKQYPTCGCSVGSSTIRFDPVECEPEKDSDE